MGKFQLKGGTEKFYCFKNGRTIQAGTVHDIKHYPELEAELTSEEVEFADFPLKKVGKKTIAEKAKAKPKVLHTRTALMKMNKTQQLALLKKLGVTKKTNNEAERVAAILEAEK